MTYYVGTVQYTIMYYVQYVCTYSVLTRVRITYDSYRVVNSNRSKAKATRNECSRRLLTCNNKWTKLSAVGALALDGTSTTRFSKRFSNGTSMGLSFNVFL